MTDTARLADLMLPACTSFERSELKFYPQQYVIWTQPVIRPLWESRSDAEIIFDLARRMVPDDALMQKGYEACIDWMLEPTKLTVEELKKYPAGYAVKNVKTPPFQKYKKNGLSQRLRRRWSLPPRSWRRQGMILFRSTRSRS